MSLTLVIGPAHAGKVALLLDRYLDVLERDPWLVGPNRVDVDVVARDLIQRRPALPARAARPPPPARSGPSATSFAPLREVRYALSRSQPRPSVRSPCAAPWRLASS